MTDDVFTEDQGGEQQAAEPNVLAELVGEDKKFKTLDDLAKGKLEADAFIEKLKEEKQMAVDELKAIQDKANEGTQVSELMALVKELKAAEVSGDIKQGDHSSADDLESKIREIMQGVSSEQTAKKNRDKGNALVLEKVGGDKEAAKLFVAERAKQLGLQPKDLADLSERSPEAFAKLIGSESKGTGSTSTMHGANTRALEHAGNAVETIDGHHTKAYYDRKRKELGTVKYLQDRRLQNQYLKDAMALQNRFNS